MHYIRSKYNETGKFLDDLEQSYLSSTTVTRYSLAAFCTISSNYHPTLQDRKLPTD